jgi:hypothetical protein
MRARSASSNAGRRRFLGGLTAVGFALVAAGCDRKLPGIPTPLANSATRRAEPTPLPPAKAPPAPKTVVGATFGRVVMLEGVSIDHDVVKSGDYVRVWLHWQSVAAAPEDWRSIGRLVTTNGRVIASEDDQVGGRRRYLTRWHVGERVVDEMRLRVMANCPPGEYGLIVGVLRPDNQTAVPITTRPAAPNHGQEDTALVGTIEVQSA